MNINIEKLKQILTEEIAKELNESALDLFIPGMIIGRTGRAVTKKVLPKTMKAFDKWAKSNKKSKGFWKPVLEWAVGFSKKVTRAQVIIGMKKALTKAAGGKEKEYDKQMYINAMNLYSPMPIPDPLLNDLSDWMLKADNSLKKLAYKAMEEFLQFFRKSMKSISGAGSARIAPEYYSTQSAKEKYPEMPSNLRTQI